MPDYLHLFRFSILTISGWILLLSVVVKFLHYRKNADKHRQRHPVATLTMIFCLVAFLPFLTFKIGAAPVPLLESYCFTALGTIMIALAVGLHIQSKRDIGVHWSDGIEADSAHHVVKTGSYALTRHPMYSSLILWGIGLAVLFANPLVLDLALCTESVTGITFQRLTKVGRARHFNESNVLQEDILHAVGQSGVMKYKDLIPLPCSHVQCTSIGFLFRTEDGKVYTLSDYIDYAKFKDVLSNRIAFDKSILDFMKKNVCCCGGSCLSQIFGGSTLLDKLRDFADGTGSSYNGMKMLRILIKNFMDAETFDVERAKQCCVGVAVGENRIIPFCVHNLKRR